MIKILSKEIIDNTFIAHVLIDGEHKKLSEQPAIYYTDEQLVERIKAYLKRYEGSND
jgi:hypothetical protein